MNSERNTQRDIGEAEVVAWLESLPEDKRLAFLHNAMLTFMTTKPDPTILALKEEIAQRHNAPKDDNSPDTKYEQILDLFIERGSRGVEKELIDDFYDEEGYASVARFKLNKRLMKMNRQIIGKKIFYIVPYHSEEDLD